MKETIQRENTSIEIFFIERKKEKIYIHMVKENHHVYTYVIKFCLPGYPSYISW